MRRCAPLLKRCPGRPCPIVPQVIEIMPDGRCVHGAEIDDPQEASCPLSTLQDLWTDLVRALGFLTRIPLPARYFEGHDGSLQRTAGTFALAGAVIAIPPAILTSLLLALHTKPELAAFLGLCLQILMTGGLHEDGLADCADGLGGGRTRERALEIMKDSRLGAYGGIALVLSVLLRGFAIAGVGEASGAIDAAFAMIAAGAIGRAAMVWHWCYLPPARTGGVASAMGQPEGSARTFAIVSGVVLYLVAAFVARGVIAALIGLVFAGMVSLMFVRLVDGKIQGHTGDTLGASEQLTEIAVLAALAIAA